MLEENTLPAVIDSATPSTTSSDWMPEKFRVTSDAGVDWEASSRRLAESYSELERRMGNPVDRPPKSGDEYLLTVPEEIAEGFEESDMLKSFRARALEANLTQKQFDFMMGMYFEIAPRLVHGAFEVDRQSTEAELRQTWPSEREYQESVRNAWAAWEGFAAPADRGRANEIGNHPVIIRLLARVGAEMREGGGIPVDAVGGATPDVQSLLRSDAYLNQSHPDHASVSAKVRAYYQRTAGNREVA